MGVGCDDFKRAYRNRKLVAEKQAIDGYVYVEKALMRVSLSKPLPKWIPTDDILVKSRFDN